MQIPLKVDKKTTKKLHTLNNVKLHEFQKLKEEAQVTYHDPAL
jgi:hypothetical protein